jgi:hypothetical protein
VPDASPHVIADQAIVARKVGVCAVLDAGLRQPIADGQAAQGDGRGGAVLRRVVRRDAGRDGGDVVAGIRLARHIKGRGAQVGLGVEEFQQEVEDVVRDLGLARDLVIGGVAPGKAGADGLVDEDHVVGGIPAVGVGGQGQVGGVDAEGPVFEKDGQLGGTAGPARHPQDERVGCRVRGPGLEEHVKHVGVVRAVELGRRGGGGGEVCVGGEGH